MPMINEAIYSLYEGVADAEAIDAVMTLGMHHPWGRWPWPTLSGWIPAWQSWRLFTWGLPTANIAPVLCCARW